ncbi:tetratricopeptide repeat protein [Pseudooceanicola nanhaiensis]|uniref:tetratricopeptide repeat protein n=1 Tax=Pseudooceanicola nanhaiensis TaxID=375761 RepID=UPI001CD20288|nr:tetratricopeptide repeat protein [Pseudooceanicola nanhaiensis]MCA0920623.1 tetratricopeptide repeat protein [Pseudooceanicola nanhaiensis]
MSGSTIRAVAMVLTQGLAIAGLGQGASAEPLPGLAGDYLAARQARITSDYGTAGGYYAEALKADPGNPALLEGAVLSEMSVGRLDAALPYAKAMEEQGAESQIARMVLAAAEAQTGDFAALLKRVEDGRGVGPLVDGLLVAWAHVGMGDMAKALVAFDAVADERGLRGFSLYHKALALSLAGDFEGAEAIYSGEADGPLQMTRRGALARIEVLSQLDRPKDALTVISALFGPDPDPVVAGMRAALQAGQMLDFDYARNAADGVAEIFYSVAAALDGDATDDYTLIYSRTAEYLRPDHIDAILLSAELLDDMGQPDLATSAYRRVPRDNPAFHAAELGRADALRRAGRTDAAIEVLTSLSDTHGELPLVHATMGDVLRGTGRYREAVQAYDAALALYTTEDRSQWFLHYARGIAQERLGNWSAAEADFRQALEMNPEDPQVMNYLGYSMVEKRENLDEALAMIERAAAAKPDSGYIIDSLGWGLYTLGRYEEAVGHMEHAAELMPVDPTVNDHLGDVYWAVGRHMEARFQWTRALSFDPEADAADRIRRKLNVGLDAVLAQEGMEPLQVAGDDR